MPPNVTIGGASTVQEGSLYTLDLSVSDPGPDTIAHWTITWVTAKSKRFPARPLM